MNQLYFKKLIMTFTLLFATSATAEPPSNMLLLEGPELSKYCDGRRKSPEINYWTIKKINKDKAYLDFNMSIQFFGCANYLKPVYAFTAVGEVVPLKFNRIVRPSFDTLKDGEIVKDQRCVCAKKSVIKGECTELYGRDTHQRGYGNGTCRYEGEYTFDPKYKLKKETIAVHIPDISKAKFELLKDIKVYSDSPEGQEFMKKKIYRGKFEKDNGLHLEYAVSKSCKDAKCSKYVGTLHDPKNVYRKGVIIPFEDEIDLRRLGDYYLNGDGLIKDDKLICAICWSDFPKCQLLNIEGKLILDDREYFIIYAHTSFDKKEHILFWPRKDKFGKMISYSSDLFCDSSSWPEEYEKQKNQK